MQCPSCGAFSKKRSLKCPECGAFRNKSSVEPTKRPAQTTVAHAATPAPASHPRQNRSLIEFPGAKHSMPAWRKELGERVREVQEKRLRENSLENGLGENLEGDNDSRAPLLELLPQAEPAPLNPLVVAALARIERAYVPSQAGGNFTNYGSGAAVAYAAQPEFIPEVSSAAGTVAGVIADQGLEQDENSGQRERIHTLSVVPNPPAVEPDSIEGETESAPAEVAPPTKLKPKRLIGGDPNDPALNYLDTIPTIPVDDCPRSTAPIHLRIFASMIDLIVVGLLSVLPLALAGLSDLAWQDNRAFALAVATAVVVTFLYSTISTALTGQTLGMKLFSLRVVDARTRMLPTGSQAAGRAIVYMLSVASTGIPLMYTFIDRDRRAAHDRFTRTEVVRI